MACRCFHKAGDFGWYHLARGQSYLVNELADEASNELVAAIEYFAQEKKHDLVLRVGLRLAKVSVEQKIEMDESTTKLIDFSLVAAPQQLTRIDRVELALAAKKWGSITIEDLKEDALAHIFLQHADSPLLREKVSRATLEDRVDIETTLPTVIGRYYVDTGDVVAGIRAYLHRNCIDVSHAVKATRRATDSAMSGGLSCSCIRQIVNMWNESGRSFDCPRVAKLLELFNSPQNASVSRSKGGPDWVNLFGRRIIIEAVDAHPTADRTLLYDFDAEVFAREVIEALVQRYEKEPRRIVEWFLVEKTFIRRATEYTEKKLKSWTENDIFELLVLFANTGASLPVTLFEEAERRKSLPRLVLRAIGCPDLRLEIKMIIAEKLEKYKKLNQSHTGLVVAAAWCLDEELSATNQKWKGGKKTTKEKSSDPIVHFASQLLSAWPKGSTIPSRNHKGNKKGSPAEPVVFSPSFCTSLLDAVVESVGEGSRIKILDSCSRQNKAQRPTSELFDVAVKHQFLSFALNLATDCLQSSTKSKGEKLSRILQTMVASSVEGRTSCHEAEGGKRRLHARWYSILLQGALRLEAHDIFIASFQAVPGHVLKDTLSRLSENGLGPITLTRLLSDLGSIDLALRVTALSLETSKESLEMLKYWIVPSPSNSMTPRLPLFCNQDLLNFLLLLSFHRDRNRFSGLSNIECASSGLNFYRLVRVFGPVLARFSRSCDVSRLASEEAEAQFQQLLRLRVELNLSLAEVKRKLFHDPKVALSKSGSRGPGLQIPIASKVDSGVRYHAASLRTSVEPPVCMVDPSSQGDGAQELLLRNDVSTQPTTARKNYGKKNKNKKKKH